MRKVPSGRAPRDPLQKGSGKLEPREPKRVAAVGGPDKPLHFTQNRRLIFPSNINQIPILILLDTGSRDNFVNARVVKGMSQSPTDVTMLSASGHVMPITG